MVLPVQVSNPDQAETSSPHQREVEMKECISLIKHIPDYFMEHRHGIILDFSLQDSEQAVIKAIREEYRNKALWLEYHLLGKVDVLAEFFIDTEKKYFEPYAKRAIAFFDLAKEIFKEWNNYPEVIPTLSQIGSPIRWMVLCEIELCGIALRNSGYTGKAIQIGKAALYDHAIKAFRWMEDVEKIEFGGPSDVTPIKALQSIAVSIAKDDIEFRNVHYSNYLKTQARCFRDLRNSPLSALYVLPDGSVKVLKRGKRGGDKHDRSKPRKGFAK